MQEVLSWDLNERQAVLQSASDKDGKENSKDKGKSKESKSKESKDRIKESDQTPTSRFSSLAEYWSVFGPLLLEDVATKLLDSGQ